MMITISVKDNIADVKSWLTGIKQDIIDKATVSALNRTAEIARNQSVREIRRTYNVKASQLKEEIVIKKANKNSIKAIISSTGKPTPLIDFAGVAQNSSGVRVRVRKDRGSKTIKHVFIAKMKNAHVGVFERIGKSRLPIKELYSVSVPAQFGSRKILDKIYALIDTEFNKRFEYELKRLVNR